jgi:type I restriction enzyme R subunit
MIVAMSRRIAAELYEEIIALKPEWHSDPISAKGVIKVVMTAASADGPKLAKHHTTKEQRKLLAERMKDPADKLKLVIVRDMWLTGFDAPSMHTLYIDKPMKGHNLMQAIARVNRVYGTSPAAWWWTTWALPPTSRRRCRSIPMPEARATPCWRRSRLWQPDAGEAGSGGQHVPRLPYEDYFEADTAESSP